MMAAGRAAELGASVALLEKNEELGKKLLITGKGRCNLAHDEEDPMKLIEAFGRNGRFLLSALSRFGLPETLDFFRSRGLNTVTERGKRIFPGPGQTAYKVLDVLKEYLEQNKVDIFYDTPVKFLEHQDGHITGVSTNSGTVRGKQFIVTTGGLSYSVTGSTGDGLNWARRTGHKITPTSPSICPVETAEIFCKELQGVSLKNVSISLWQNGKKKDECFGEMLFTHFGISGPIVMNLSKTIGKLLKKGSVTIFLDTKPALDRQKLDARLLREFKEHHGKELRTVIKDMLPRAMVPAIIKLAGIDQDRKIDEITKEERINIIESLKAIAITPTKLLGYGWAIITSGGISLKDVDPKTMSSKVVDNLFFAGEVLDLDAPTGGFNLQECWSTGFVAGEEASQRAICS